MNLPSYLLAVPVLVALFQSPAFANPEPDIPVRCHFDKDGACQITVEIDPRCFTSNPFRERYRMKADLDYDPPAELQRWKDLTADALPRWLAFEFDPPLALQPAFTLAFTGQNQAALKKPDDPFVVTATWKFKRPTEMKSLRVRATKNTRFAVVVRHFQNGVEQKRFATLFPGETSFPMEAAKP